MSEEQTARKAEDMVRYDSNSLPHSPNWQDDLQRWADENRTCLEKAKDYLKKENL